jgi:DNA-binding protein H-NS
MTTLKELEEQIAQLEAQADKLRKEERASAIRDINEKVAQYKIAISEIKFSIEAKQIKPADKTKKKAEQKYSNPANPEQTWSGRGVKPEWFKSAKAKGYTDDQMLIKKPS